MSNRVKRALARRERMRRARDQAWMYFAGFAAAAAFGWASAVAHFTTEPRDAWWVLLLYALIAVFSTFGAYRSFGASKRLSRRLDEAQPLDESYERDASAWSEPSAWKEIWGRRP